MVRVERSGPVVTVILHRPGRRNAVDRDTADALVEAFDAFDRDDSAHVAVLWGDGGTFCAGADLVAVTEGRPNRLEPTGPGPLGPTRTTLSKPVVAAVAGYAVAGGLELALWCDLRVVEEDATFGVYCRRWGVPLVDGGTVRLSRVVGQSRALDMILTGRAVPAKEAFEWGLANRLVPKGESRKAAEDLAAEIAGFPQRCVRSDRASALEQWTLPVDAAIAREFAIGMETIQSGETEQGAARFARGAGRHGGFER
ncbi:MAG TPA: crotonase/enoyl-CoA hydratase family protein [Polyangiaceae bacterium]|jgi:enoyl-CoA hydratase